MAIQGAADIGELRRDSPVLWDMLARIRSVNQERLAAAYQLVVTADAMAEVGFQRPQNASFNPRPARICQLLIEAGVRDETTLVVAFFVCVPMLETFVGLPTFEEELTLARSVIDDELTAETELAWLALSLDNLRHLHQRKLEIGAQRAIVLEVVRRVEKLEKPATSPSEPLQRLLTLVRKAIQRYD